MWKGLILSTSVGGKGVPAYIYSDKALSLGTVENAAAVATVLATPDYDGKASNCGNQRPHSSSAELEQKVPVLEDSEWTNVAAAKTRRKAPNSSIFSTGSGGVSVDSKNGTGSGSFVKEQQVRQKQQEEEQRRRHREKLQRETEEKQRHLEQHQKQMQAEQRQQQVEEQKKKERQQQQQQQMDEESLHRQQQHNYQDEPEQGQINEQEEAVKAEVAISAAAAQISSPLVCGDPFDDFDDVEALLRMAGNGYDENVFALLRAAGVDDAEGLARRMASEDMDVEALKLCSRATCATAGRPVPSRCTVESSLPVPSDRCRRSGWWRQARCFEYGRGRLSGHGRPGADRCVTKANAFISQQLGMSPSPLPPPRRSGLEVPASFSSYPPEELCCPITQEILFDPVRAADGYVYERAAIEGWIQTKSLLSEPGIPSPIANVALPHLRLDPVPKKKMQADAWRVANYGRY